MYRPRRASKRWLEGAPSYVFDCFDHKRGMDRYTILLGGPDYWTESMGRQMQYLGASRDGAAISQFGQCATTFRPAHHRVRWLDLPEELRKHVMARCGKGLSRDAKLSLLDRASKRQALNLIGSKVTNDTTKGEGELDG